MAYLVLYNMINIQIIGKEALKSFGHWQIYVIIISCQLGKREEENTEKKYVFRHIKYYKSSRSKVKIPIELI